MADSGVKQSATELEFGGGSGVGEGEAEVSVPEQPGSHEIEETNPEMLKNTPSNIRKLYNEIQQCEGRQKYLAQTKSPSDGFDVRWFFCKVSLGVNELAASVPRTEVVGKGEYFRFGMRDSLAIEASFLQREEELLSSWWKEFADCSDGPRGHPSASLKLNAQAEVSSLETAASAQYAFEEERVGVPVKGGLYEVDLVKRHCFPVYWSGENRRVLRGHWFARKGSLDWLPLREDVGEQLEFAYRSKVWRRRTFQPSGLFAARVDLQGSSPGLHALFTGEDDTWEAWLNVNASGFSSVISLRGHGIMLRRGYAASQASKPTQDELRQKKEEDMDDYCSQVPVRHLVFMVHGIGQRLEKSNLVDDVTNFCHITAGLAERHLTTYQRSNKRVLFIPCQWRRGLKLSGESAVERITLDGVRGLRVMLSATVHDVLYYMSPIYCQDIINSVSNQLNKLYLKFLKRNPGYDGKVSLYGHSLGSVISYDILCHQENLSSPFPMDWMYKENNVGEECNSMSSQDKHTSAAEENENVRSSNEMDNQSEQPTSPVLEPECAEDPSGIVGFPVTSPIEEPSAEATSLDEKEDVSLLQKDADKQIADSRGLVSCVEDDSGGDIGELSDGLQEKDQDETIKLLKKSAEDQSEQPTSPVLEPECAEDPSGIVGFPVTSPIEEPSAEATILDEKEDVSLLQKDADKQIADSRGLVSCVEDDSGGDIGELSDGLQEKDQDETIKLLKKELDSLRARIGELESQCKNQEKCGEPRTVTSQSEPELEAYPCRQDKAPKRYTPYIHYTKLEFKVDTFFAVGSPLGVFLALRNIRIGIGKGGEYWEEENINEEMPACCRMFNIFHPFDPVAYRVEPLICKEYTRRPVIIPYHKGGKRLHIGLQEFAENIAFRSQAVMDQLHSARAKVLTLCQSRDKDRLDEVSEDSEGNMERSYGSIMMERLTGSENGRVDHVLQDKTFQHPYISAIGAHTNYWRDYDTALFILKHLYRDIPEDDEEARSGSSEHESGSGEWLARREDVDEELPLTFSDSNLVRNFSRKARNLRKK